MEKTLEQRIEELEKKVAELEGRVQAQPVKKITKSNYPTTLVFKKDISNGITKTKDGLLIDSSNAITVNIDINYNNYSLEQLREAINEVCQLIPEYFR